MYTNIHLQMHPTYLLEPPSGYQSSASIRSLYLLLRAQSLFSVYLYQLRLD